MGSDPSGGALPVTALHPPEEVTTLHTTGSRIATITRPWAVRLILLAVLAAAFLGAQAIIANQAQSAPITKFIVNSVGDDVDDDIGDGDCDTGATVVDPNGVVLIECTLRAAIEEANAILADEINFNPKVFSPATIELTADLPSILVELVIDATGATVIVDGNSQAWHVFEVFAGHDDFDFSLIGGGSTMTIVDSGSISGTGEGDGVLVCASLTDPCPSGALGDTLDFSLGNIIIDGVDISGVSDDGVDIRGRNLKNIVVTDGEITGGDNGVIVRAFGDGGGVTGDLGNNSVEVSDSTIRGEGGDGVHLSFNGDLGSKIHANVINNDLIVGEGSGDDGVNLSYCGESLFFGNCSVVDSTINFNVTGNLDLTGSDDDGIDIDIDADEAAPGSHAAEININITGNGPIDGDTDEGVDVNVDVAGSSDSTVITHIDGNGDIVGGDKGVGVVQNVGDDSDNTSIVTVNV
ncbi:MAG: CSLREA domain-containing protein, partial [Planctomycetes bacterium]|nr:CSLREA domain-containing protein [Planctomycetota bacterium]